MISILCVCVRQATPVNSNPSISCCVLIKNSLIDNCNFTYHRVNKYVCIANKHVLGQKLCMHRQQICIHSQQVCTHSQQIVMHRLLFHVLYTHPAIPTSLQGQLINMHLLPLRTFQTISNYCTSCVQETRN